MTKPEERPTAGELLSRARGGGLECPDCGCRDFRVTNTWWRADGTVGRQRRCRHCGYPVGSDETFQPGSRRRQRGDQVAAEPPCPEPAPDPVIVDPPAIAAEAGTLPPELALDCFEDAPQLDGPPEDIDP